MPSVQVRLGLGDPHHYPLKEDPRGTVGRVEKSLELLEKIAPRSAPLGRAVSRHRQRLQHDLTSKPR